jgi:hypothetical protein
MSNKAHRRPKLVDKKLRKPTRAFAERKMLEAEQALALMEYQAKGRQASHELLQNRFNQSQALMAALLIELLIDHPVAVSQQSIDLVASGTVRGLDIQPQEEGGVTITLVYPDDDTV